MTLSVIKVGGSALQDAGWLADFAGMVARAEGPLVVVHGGGPEVSALSARLNVPVEWANGRRVTTEAAMSVATMVLSGLVNERIVRALLAGGVDAVGLSGVDGALLRSEIHAAGAIGRVGTLPQVRAPLLRALVSNGHVPVISSVSLGPDGGALNVNADEAATAIAAALGASELLYLTNVEGVLGSQGLLSAVGVAEAGQLIEQGVATAGMRVKLEAARAGIAARIPTIRIGPMRMLLDPDAGTRVMAAKPVEVAA